MKLYEYLPLVVLRDVKHYVLQVVSQHVFSRLKYVIELLENDEEYQRERKRERERKRRER